MLIALVLIPQTRQPIQILLSKSIALVKPVSVNDTDLKTIPHYNWTLTDENNLSFNFNETKGKVVLINFWATWCPPCIAEMPSLQLLYNAYKDKVVFLFVTNEDFTKVNPFLTKNNYIFKVQKPITAYPEYFDISTIPRTFLIDKLGNIIIDESGAANWNSEKIRKTIDKLLK